MKYFLTITVFIFSIQISVSQVNDFVLSRADKIYTFDSKDAGVKSEKCFFKSAEWAAGSITLNNGNTSIVQNIRYNLLDDQIELLLTGELYSINSNYVKSFTIENILNKFLFDRIDLGDLVDQKSSFLLKLVDGEAALYKYITAIQKKSKLSPILSAGKKKIKTKQKESFFFKFNGDIYIIPKKKKKARKIFSDHNVFPFEVDVDDYNLSKESDLIKLFNLNNTKNN